MGMDSLIAFNTKTHIHLSVSTSVGRSIIRLGNSDRPVNITDGLFICSIGSNALSTRFMSLIKQQVLMNNARMDTFNKKLSVGEVANLVRKTIYANIRRMQIDCQFIIFDTSSKNTQENVYCRHVWMFVKESIHSPWIGSIFLFWFI